MPKKLVPNPEYERAHYFVKWSWHCDAAPYNQPPEIRTNNPRFIHDGMREEDQIPTHIEVDA